MDRALNETHERNYNSFQIKKSMIFSLISGYDETCSFSDLGSSVVKVLSMFTGEFSFEDVFRSHTRFDKNFETNIFVFVLYAYFLLEMCIILMNLTIGLAISNIQVQYNLLDKEVILIISPTSNMNQ